MALSSEMTSKHFSMQDVLKQQVETRTKDGRRRITPLFVAAQVDIGLNMHMLIKDNVVFIFHICFL